MNEPSSLSDSKLSPDGGEAGGKPSPDGKADLPVEDANKGSTFDRPSQQDETLTHMPLAPGAAQPVRTAPQSIPAQLGEYMLLDQLGRGGMAVVYRARHQRLDRIAAIKIIASSMLESAAAKARFQREMKAIARVSHPNIVAAYDAGEQNGLQYLVLECVEGTNLTQMVRRDHAVPWQTAVEYVLQAAAGLGHAHRHGILHRDVKPSNLMLDRSGTIKILDLGLARVSTADSEDIEASSFHTQSGALLGTPAFMAPEQALQMQAVDERSDIYSLGCTLFYLIAGRPPYVAGTPFEVLVAHREAPVPRLRDHIVDVPTSLEAVFQRMMAKTPRDRYQSCDDVIHDLRMVGNAGTGVAASAPIPSVRAESSPPADDKSIGLDAISDTLDHLGILSREACREFLLSHAPDVRPQTSKALLSRLVAAGRISPYQSAQLLRGDASELRVGDYLFEGKLAELESGTLYQARHATTRAPATVKVFAGETVLGEEARGKLSQLVELEHPHVLKVREFGDDGSRCFLATDELPGMDLDWYVKREGTFDFSAALGCIAQAGEALESAAEKQIVHGFVSPTNLIYHEGHVSVAGFDLRHLAREQVGESLRWAVATPPELLKSGAITVQSDMFRLGWTLVYLITGLAPDQLIGEDDSVPRLRELLDGVPDGLQQFLDRATAREPSQRFGSWAEFLAAIESVHDAPVRDRRYPSREGSAAHKTPARPAAPRLLLAHACVAPLTVALYAFSWGGLATTGFVALAAGISWHCRKLLWNAAIPALIAGAWGLVWFELRIPGVLYLAEILHSLSVAILGMSFTEGTLIVVGSFFCGLMAGVGTPRLAVFVCSGLPLPLASAAALAARGQTTVGVVVMALLSVVVGVLIVEVGDAAQSGLPKAE